MELTISKILEKSGKQKLGGDYPLEEEEYLYA